MTELEHILATIGDLAALGRADALELADRIRDTAIAHLERDPAMPRRCYREWCDALAGLHADIAAQISKRILHLVHRDEVIDAIEGAGQHDSGIPA
jgi:hypothetical protein